MRVLDLCCGTRSFAKWAEEQGHEVVSIDNDPQFNPTYCEDIRDIDTSKLGMFDFIWASPPCQGYSVAALGKNWERLADGTAIPKTERARQADELVKACQRIIKECLKKDGHFIIENPRAMLRTRPFMQPLSRTTVTYCQYGDTRMKPTDLFHNLDGFEGRCCKNGDSCHEAAPRGSRTGTQGIKGAIDRGRVPPAIFDHIFEFISKKARDEE